MNNAVSKRGTKITVLGTGSVGATIAYTLALEGLCSEILLVDIDEKKAEGEAMDIRQGNTFVLKRIYAAEKLRMLKVQI